MSKKEKRIKRRKVQQQYTAFGEDGKSVHQRVHVAAVEKLTSSDMLALFRPLDKSDDADFADFQAISGWMRREGRYLVEYVRMLRSMPNMWGGQGDKHDMKRQAVMDSLRALLVQDQQTIDDMDEIGKLGLTGSETFERCIKYLAARLETSGGDKK